LPLDRRPVGLRRTAAEVLHIVARHKEYYSGSTRVRFSRGASDLVTDFATVSAC
jgi:hypothetical protein